MDLHGFDLNLLVALDALLAEKSVTNAGRRVHLSQSAMSGVLARLRQALNDKLLVASRSGMTLTPLAESLVEPVRSILEQVHRTIIVNVPFDPATSRRVLTLAASDYAVTVLLTDALRQINKDAPGVCVVIIRCGTDTGSGSRADRHHSEGVNASLFAARFCSKTFTAIVWAAIRGVSATRFTPINAVASAHAWSGAPRAAAVPRRRLAPQIVHRPRHA